LYINVFETISLGFAVFDPAFELANGQRNQFSDLLERVSDTVVQQIVVSPVPYDTFTRLDVLELTTAVPVLSLQLAFVYVAGDVLDLEHFFQGV